MRLAQWWPYARRRWPVDTAVRSEQLTVCQVDMAPTRTARSSRIDDDPPTLFVGARRPERARRLAVATSDGRGLGRVLVHRLATHTVGPAEHSWARGTISNRRLLVCKAAAKHPHGLVGLPRGLYVQVMSPRCVAASTASRLVVARLGTLWAHRGVASRRASKIDLLEFTFEALACELTDRIRIVNLLEEREPRPLYLLGPVLAERILRHGQPDVILLMVKHHGVG